MFDSDQFTHQIRVIPGTFQYDAKSSAYEQWDLQFKKLF